MKVERNAIMQEKTTFFTVTMTLCGWSLIKVPQHFKFVLVLG